jgi:LuxR family quorum-sensing transcriptional regulator LasR
MEPNLNFAQMKTTERFSDLMCCDSVSTWRKLVFKFGNDLGFEQTLLAILSDSGSPAEVEFAFLHSNYSTDWRKKYDAEKMQYIDPAVTHCISSSTPQIWSPDIFFTRKQLKMYEGACWYGLRSGVTLPIHGAQGELGILCFMTDMQPDKRFQREARSRFPELSYLRDIIFETSLRFMKPSKSPEEFPPVTSRELECLRWCAAGKSSWEIARILDRSESLVNFHFTSLRKKFSVSSRQQVVVKAMRYGLIHP